MPFIITRHGTSTFSITGADRHAPFFPAIHFISDGRLADGLFERPGEARTAIGRAPISAGEYSFVDHPPERPLVYRAVWTDGTTGVPYGALLRKPVG